MSEREALQKVRLDLVRQIKLRRKHTWLLRHIHRLLQEGEANRALLILNQNRHDFESQAPGGSEPQQPAAGVQSTGNGLFARGSSE